MPTMVPTVAFSVTALGRGIGVADRRDVELVGVVDGDGVALGGDRAIGGGGPDGDRLGCAGLPRSNGARHRHDARRADDWRRVRSGRRIVRQ